MKNLILALGLAHVVLMSGKEIRIPEATTIFNSSKGVTEVWCIRGVTCGSFKTEDVKYIWIEQKDLEVER